MWQQIHIWPSFLSLTKAPDLWKTMADLKRAYLDNWNHPVDPCCTPTTGNHQKMFFVPYTNSYLYIRLFSFSLQRLPNCAITHVNACGQHMTILRNLDIHYSGMFCSLTLELATYMLYNHGINFLPLPRRWGLLLLQTWWNMGNYHVKLLLHDNSVYLAFLNNLSTI